MTTQIASRPTEFSSDQLMHTVLEAARLLRVGRSTIYVLMNSGALRAVHIGRSIRISHAELERYVATLDAEARRSSVDNAQGSPPAA